MIFDATVQTMSMEVVPAETEEDGEVKADAPVILAVVLSMGIPTPNGMAQLPAGLLRIPMSQEAAKRYSEALALGAEGKAPEPEKKSDLYVPGSQDEVAQAAKAAELANQFKG